MTKALFGFKPLMSFYECSNKQEKEISNTISPLHYVRLEFQMIEKCDLSVLAFIILEFIAGCQI